MNADPMYFCATADDKHFPLLLNMIGSIFKHNEKELGQILIYNLGLNENNLSVLNKIEKVKVFEIERTNLQILTDIQTDNNRWVKGLFSWKPVIIKDALDKVPYVLYLDSGTTISKPLNNLFKHIIQNGYLLFDCGHSIEWMTTKYLIDKLNLNSEENKWLLDPKTTGIDAGFQGMSRKLYDSYVMPMYELSKDIRNFIDDKTCPNGWGCGRHDQTLYSILARQLNLHIEKHDVEGCSLLVDNIKIPFNITHTLSKVNDSTDVFRSRWNITQNQLEENTSCIKLKQTIIDINKINNDFIKFSSQWANTPSYNEAIYNIFEYETDSYDFLNAHVNIIAKYQLGYGEKAFRYLWFLVLSQLPKNGKFLEIGVFKGSILALSQMISNILNLQLTSFGLTPLNNTGDKYSVYNPDDYEKAIMFLYQELDLSLDNTRIIPGLSTDNKCKESAIKHGPYDLVYIDGGHDYETVVNDIELSDKILKTNGLLVMDDASSLLNFKFDHKGFKGHQEVGLAIKDKLDNNPQYKHLFACGHNRVWKKVT